MRSEHWQSHPRSYKSRPLLSSRPAQHIPSYPRRRESRQSWPQQRCPTPTPLGSSLRRNEGGLG